MNIRSIKRIAIITFSNHRMQLDNICYLFENFDVTVFSSEAHYRAMHRENKVYFKRHKWINKKDNETIADFLDTQKDAIDASDLILIPTLRTDLEWFISNTLSPPIVFFVHNLNYWMFPEERIGLWKKKTAVSKIKYLIRLPRVLHQEKIRNQMLAQVDVLNFHDPRMADKYNRKKKGNKHIITTIPDGLFIQENGWKKLLHDQPSAHAPGRDELRFTIPGSVAPSRKDYVYLLKAFRKSATRISNNMQLILLGRLKNSPEYGRELKQLSDSINASQSNLKVIYYDTNEMIPDRIYNRVMTDSDVIISGIRPNSTKQFHGYTEIYGKTVTSGSSADVIRFAKPGVFPASYQAPPGIRDAVDTFADKTQLIDIITRFTDKVYLKQKTVAAENCALRFTREKVLHQFMQQISKLPNSAHQL